MTLKLSMLSAVGTLGCLVFSTPTIAQVISTDMSSFDASRNVSASTFPFTTANSVDSYTQDGVTFSRGFREQPAGYQGSPTPSISFAGSLGIVFSGPVFGFTYQDTLGIPLSYNINGVTGTVLPTGGTNFLGFDTGVGGSINLLLNANTPAASDFITGFQTGTSSGNQTAVPEPAAWCMMILGMGAIGFAMRRQKVTTRVSYAA